MNDAEMTEQEKLRAAHFSCLSCGTPVRVGPNYAQGMIIPRTLELSCSACLVINIFYRPEFWATSATA